MQNTPQSSRAHVSLFGETNAGKSALFNAILGQKSAIVSPISGTTTDPVAKSMELLPYGPVVLVDTAGLNDTSPLGRERLERTNTIIARTDFALYVIDAGNYHKTEYEQCKAQLDRHKIPHLIVLTKIDTLDECKIVEIQRSFDEVETVSIHDSESIIRLKNRIAAALSSIEDKSGRLIGGLLPPGSAVIMVIPVDSEAPRGRLILPQVQLIRDCLDHGIRCNVTTDAYLREALAESKRVDLVITDSQAFQTVSAIVPPSIPLTSFSILMARHKGGLSELYQGIRAIAALKDGDSVLIAETCTHSHNHEDIGRVKIPAVLTRTTGKALHFQFRSGHDYGDSLSGYALIVHCGGCMITPREMNSRIMQAQEAGVPITNYGMVLAYGSGILDRGMEIINRTAQLSP